MMNKIPNPHILSTQHWLDLEIAIEVVAEMKGIVMRKILSELQESAPNKNRMIAWKLELQNLGIERNQLYDPNQNKTIIQKAKKQYSAEVKLYYARPEKILVLSMSEPIMNEIISVLHSELFGQSQPEEFPTCYILGGQPSSGKTNLTERIIGGFVENKKNRPVIINGDEFRRFHPEYEKFMQDGDKDSSASTQLFANSLVDYFQEYALEKGYSFIIEGTMRTLAAPLNTVKNAKKKNYNVETHILAVHQERSWVGVHERYESQKTYFGKGRFTQKKVHDEAFENIPKVIDALYFEPEALNKMFVYTAQAMTLIYETHRTLGGLWNNNKLPSEILNQERKRFLDTQEQERISWGWEFVHASQM